MGRSETDQLSRVLRLAKLRSITGHAADAVLAGVATSVFGWIGSAATGYWFSVLISPVWAIGVGACVAIGWFAAHLRYTRTMNVAVALDQTNQTHDLLASAWAMRTSEEPFAGIIRGLAISRTTQPLKLPVALGRFGPRLHVAAILTLIACGLASSLIQTRDSAARNDPNRTIAANSSDPPDRIVSPIRPPRTGESDVSQTASATEPGTASTAHATGANPTASGNPISGQEGGRANDGTTSQIDPKNAMNPTASGQNPGSGDGTSSNTSGEGVARGSAGAESPAGQTAPWQSTGWASDRTAALDRAQNADYSLRQRELIRAYFQR